MQNVYLDYRRAKSNQGHSNVDQYQQDRTHRCLIEKEDASLDTFDAASLALDANEREVWIPTLCNDMDLSTEEAESIVCVSPAQVEATPAVVCTAPALTRPTLVVVEPAQTLSGMSRTETMPSAIPDRSSETRSHDFSPADSLETW